MKCELCKDRGYVDTEEQRAFFGFPIVELCDCAAGQREHMHVGYAFAQAFKRAVEHLQCGFPDCKLTPAEHATRGDKPVRPPAPPPEFI